MTRAGIVNKNAPHWSQERRYRGKLGYTRHSGYPSRRLALRLARQLRKRGHKAHVKKESYEPNTGWTASGMPYKRRQVMYYIWWQRLER